MNILKKELFLYKLYLGILTGEGGGGLLKLVFLFLISISPTLVLSPQTPIYSHFTSVLNHIYSASPNLSLFSQLVHIFFLFLFPLSISSLPVQLIFSPSLSLLRYCYLPEYIYLNKKNDTKATGKV